MTQAPGPVASQGEATKGKTDGLANSYTGTAESTNYPASKKQHQQQRKEEGDGARGVQGGEDRLTPDIAHIRFEYRCEPRDEPPEQGYNGYQNDQPLTCIGILFGANAPDTESEDNRIFSIAIEPDRILEQIEPGFVEPTQEGDRKTRHGERHDPATIASRQNRLLRRLIRSCPVAQRMGCVHAVSKERHFCREN